MTKYSKYFFVAFMAVAAVATAQTSLRSWQKGALTWTDFKTVDKSIGKEHSYLEFIIDTRWGTQEVDGVEMAVQNAVAYVNRDLSWVDSHYRTPQELRYNQVLFNIAEIERRRLQVAIDTGGSINSDYYMRRAVAMVDSVCHTTSYGADTAMVAWWEQEVKQQMNETAAMMVEKHNNAIKIPKQSTVWGMGMSMGAGFKGMAGELHNYFKPSGGFYMDLYCLWWRNWFNCGMYVGGGRSKMDTILAVNPNDDLYRSDRLSVMELYIDYGFAVVDNNKWHVSPFIGYGMQAFLYEDDDEYSDGPTEGCWRAGLDVKYHFFHGMEYAHKKGDHLLASLNAKVYVTKDHLKSIIAAPKGYTINVQVGLSLTGQSSKDRKGRK